MKTFEGYDVKIFTDNVEESACLIKCRNKFII